MDEEAQKKEQETDEKKQEDTAPAENRGDVIEKTDDKPNDKPNLVEQAKAENDRKAELLKQELELQERKEKLHAEQMVGGRAGLAVAEKPKKLTDTEYAEALERGEVDPLREDGFAK